MTLHIRAHAKINPYLWVGPLRPDGYHEIDTTLQAVELHDVLTFSAAEKPTVRCSDPTLDGESNLVFKAYRLASELVDLPTLDIYIEKSIPTQAGLGGGSSDCASALRVLAKLSSGALDKHIVEIGKACGSDVSFFLGSSTRARATGKGDVLQPLTPIEIPVVLAKPLDVSCDTAGAYRRLDEIQNRPLTRPDSMPYNDFERVAPCESLELIDRMRSMGITECGLCGSGSAVYGFTSDAAGIADMLRSEEVWATVTKTITNFGEPWTP
jgi:4-diphosphocytidyl-2-C-methyl-D-erythritol kinase